MPFSNQRRTELARLADLHAVEQPEQVEPAICELLNAAIGAELVHVVELTDAAGQARVRSSRPGMFPEQVRHYFERHAHDHPRVRMRAQADGAARLSDLVEWRQWQRSDFHRHCHAPLGIRDSLSFPIEDRRTGNTAWPALLRVGRPFSRSERDHLEALRPHVVAAWRRTRPAIEDRVALDVEALLRRHIEGWRLVGLTTRECQVLAWLVQGLGYREIGQQLSISAKTIEHHAARVAAKLGVRTRGEAVRRALTMR
jgi:ATP/maltotriose-dependent transcriptional regulator MalT